MGKEWRGFWKIAFCAAVALLALHFAVGFIRLFHPANNGKWVYITHTRMTEQGPITETRSCGYQYAGVPTAAVTKCSYFYIPGTGISPMDNDTESYTLTFTDPNSGDITLTYQIWSDGEIAIDRRSARPGIKSWGVEEEIYASIAQLYNDIGDTE